MEVNIMAVLKEWRYEIHVSMAGILEDVVFYVIDRQTGIRHPFCKWPQDVLELMYSDFAAFNAQTVVVEDVDPDRGPMGVYGTWTYYLPQMGTFMMRHPKLRWFFGKNPDIKLDLNEAGEALAEEERRRDIAAVWI